MKRKGYKVELNLTYKQKSLFNQYAGLSRFAYNWGLGKCIQNYEDTKKSLSAIDLHKLLVQEKKIGNFDWMYQYSKTTPQESLRYLEKAYKQFFRNIKNKSKKQKGFPKFKGKHLTKNKFTLINPHGISIAEGKIKLPKIGWVKLQEKDRLPTDNRVVTVHLSEKAGKWFISLQVPFEPDQLKLTKETIGIDVGIKTLATLSTGQTYYNPKHYYKLQDKLKLEQRRLSKKQKGSKNREKQKLKVQKVHYKISCQRQDYLQKITSEIVKAKPSMIVIEDLNVSGMVKNHRLAKSLMDSSFGEFKRMIEYKCDWAGIEVVKADRLFPSSKMCFKCGKIKEDLTLSDRTYKCSCGLEIDRDLNASLNLQKYGESSRNCIKKSVESKTSLSVA